jgi:protein MpaA
VRGDPIEVFRCGQEPGGLLVVGGMHGDERGGAALVRELTIRLACPDGGGALTIVPVLNPDGLYEAARANAHGVDLNRNLPAHNWVPGPSHGGWPMSEPESRALYDVLVRANPAFVINVHEGTEPLVDWDGPAADAAQGLGTCTGLEVRRIGTRPGSLGSLVGVDWGRPLVTLELPRAASSLPVETLWATYGHCLLEAVRRAPDAAGGDGAPARRSRSSRCPFHRNARTGDPPR